jgi:hypothetical protein
MVYSDEAGEQGMTRTATILVLLGLALISGGCSKCGGLFGSPGVCHSDTTSAR